MAAFKYLSRNNSKSFIQASVQPKMGKNYIYKGRVYCQAKSPKGIDYADINYNLNIKLLSWTTNTIDVEFEVKNIIIGEEYNIQNSECKSIIDSLMQIEDTILYIRVSNAGKLLRLFNVSDLSNLGANEHAAMSQLEMNPIISTFLFGQIEEKVKCSQAFKSTLLSGLIIESDLKIESEKEKFNNSKGICITNRKITFDKEKQAELAEKVYDNRFKRNEMYDHNTIVTYNKGINKILPYSIILSTEETLGEDNSVFISVGLDKVVQSKDIDLKTKICSIVQKNMSAIF